MYQQKIQSQFQQKFPWNYYLCKLTKASESLCMVCSLRLYKNLSYNNSLSQLMCHTSMKRGNTWRSWINRTKNTVSGKKGKIDQKYSFRRKKGKCYFTSDSWLTVYKNEATFPMVSQEKKPSDQHCEPGLPDGHCWGPAQVRLHQGRNQPFIFQARTVRIHWQLQYFLNIALKRFVHSVVTITLVFNFYLL